MSIIRRILDKLEGSRTVKTLFILMGAALAIGVVSGIGSTCTTFDPRWWKLVNSDGGYTFAIIGDFHLVFIFTYIVTWLVALAWGVLFWALGTRKSWFYLVALITSIAGFFSGFIPSAILFYEWYMSYGVNGMMFTPSWFRTINNGIIFIVLIIPWTRNGIRDFIAEKSASSVGSVGSQVSQFAFVLFGFGIVMLIQPFIMPMHIVNGENIASSYGYLLASGTLQFIGGMLCILLGLLLRVTGQFIDVIHSSKPTPLKI